MPTGFSKHPVGILSFAKERIVTKKHHILAAFAAATLALGGGAQGYDFGGFGVPCPAIAEAAGLFTGVSEKAANILDDGTDYSVYLAYPGESSEAFLYHNSSVRSASMIKMFIMAAAMEKVAAGEMSLDEMIVLNDYDKVGGSGILGGYADGTVLPLRTFMELMITESDNTATNIIINRLGMGTVNDYIARKGYSDTVLKREMMDMEAIAAGRENMTSAKDLGDIFVKIYNHQCVNHELDEVMLEFLKGQTDTDCLPEALPGRVVAHKTGALPGLFHDGGIVYGGKRDAVIVLLAEDFTSEYTATERMKEFAAAVLGD